MWPPLFLFGLENSEPPLGRRHFLLPGREQRRAGQYDSSLTKHLCALLYLQLILSVTF